MSWCYLGHLAEKNFASKSSYPIMAKQPQWQCPAGKHLWTDMGRVLQLLSQYWTLFDQFEFLFHICVFANLLGSSLCSVAGLWHILQHNQSVMWDSAISTSFIAQMTNLCWWHWGGGSFRDLEGDEIYAWAAGVHEQPITEWELCRITSVENPRTNSRESQALSSTIFCSWACEMNLSEP